MILMTLALIVHVQVMSSAISFSDYFACDFNNGEEDCGFTVWNDNDNLRWVRMPMTAIHDALIQPVTEEDAGDDQSSGFYMIHKVNVYTILHYD